MNNRTTFTILARGAGFFAHGGHDESDDEVTLGGKVEEESYSDDEFSKLNSSSKLNSFSMPESIGGMPLFIDVQGPINDMGMSGLNIPGEVVNPGLRGELDALFEQPPYQGSGEFDDIFGGDDDDDLSKYLGPIEEYIDFGSL